MGIFILKKIINKKTALKNCLKQMRGSSGQSVTDMLPAKY